MNYHGLKAAVIHPGDEIPDHNTRILHLRNKSKKIIRIFAAEFIRIMKTKLTLSVEKEIIMKAKAISSQSGISLSELIENFLRQLTLKEKIRPGQEESELVRSLKGSVRVPEDFNYDSVLSEELMKKYRK